MVKIEFSSDSDGFRDKPSWVEALVGTKAYGLSQIPKDWYPQYFVICDVHETQGINPQLLSAPLERLDLDPTDRVIVRSSAANETLEHRGQLESRVCDASAADVALAANNILHHFEVSSDQTNGFSIVVQRWVPPQLSGHLSNERRVSREFSTWRYECFGEPGESIIRDTYSIKYEKASMPPRQLECIDRSELEGRFRVVSQSLSGHRRRYHLEWVWDGSRLWIVQIDTERERKSVSPFVLPSRATASSTVDLPLAVNSSGEWPKVKTLKLFRSCGVSVPEIYIIEGEPALDSLIEGNVNPAIRENLTRLVETAVVIRTDRTMMVEDHGFLLPRTDSITRLEEAEAFLIEKAQAFATEGIGSKDFCFLIHRFIPAAGCAFALSRPNVPRVWVDATWGVPDSLSYYPHDTYEFDLDEDMIAAKRLRCKDRYVGVTEAFAWKEMNCSEPWDWKDALSEQEVRNIAMCAIRLSQSVGEALGVMFFTGLQGDIDESQPVPWFTTTDVVLKGSGASRRFHPRVQYTVRNVEEVRELTKRTDLPANFSIRLSPDTRHLRSKDFLRESGELALLHGALVELEGSVLSHSYYILTKMGVRVSCIEQFAEPVQKKRFGGKLVRDKIPARIDRRGGKPLYERLSESETIDFLKQKLLEEAHEAHREVDSEAVLQELTDLFEVLRELASRLGVGLEGIVERADKKKEERGGFSAGYVLIETRTVPLIDARPEAGVLFPDNTGELHGVVPPRARTRRAPRDQKSRRIRDNLVLGLIPPVNAPVEEYFHVMTALGKLEVRVCFGKENIELSFLDPKPISPQYHQPMLFDEM